MIAGVQRQDQRSLAAQIDWLQRQLDEIKGQLTAAPETELPTVTAQAVRSIISARREREVIFGAELFADPTWDMLLQLYAGHLAQQSIATSELCVAAAVPPTTALRWIERLDQNGWVTRRPDPTDARRIFVELSHRGLSAMQDFFSRANHLLGI